MATGYFIGEDAKALIKSMTIGGATQAAIAEKIGCTQQTVHYHQKKMNLKASNKWHFGETALIVQDPGIKESEPEPVKESPKGAVVTACKSIESIGLVTKFLYKVEARTKSLRIYTGYNAHENDIPFEIDLDDIHAFANELEDIVKMLERL